MKKLWIRIGAEIELPDEINVINASQRYIKELEDIIHEAVLNKKFRISGSTYAPYFEDERYENQLLVKDEPEVFF